MKCTAEVLYFFFFNDTATTEISPLSLHDALPISLGRGVLGDGEYRALRSPPRQHGGGERCAQGAVHDDTQGVLPWDEADRQTGVVFASRAGAHHYRVVLGAEFVGEAQRFGRADPARAAARRRQAPIERLGVADGDGWTGVGHLLGSKDMSSAKVYCGRTLGSLQISSFGGASPRTIYGPVYCIG